MKFSFKILIPLLCAFLCGAWLFVLAVFPIVANSKFFVSKISNYIGAKTETIATIEGFKLSISPIFKIKINLDKLMLLDGENKTANLEGLEAEIHPLNSKSNKFIIEKFYFQKTNLRSVDKKEQKSKKKFNFLNLPDVYIKEGILDFGSLDVVTSRAHFKDFALEDKVLSFDLDLKSNFISKSFKVNKSDKIYILKDGLYTEELSLNFKNSYAKIQGKFFDTNGLENFYITGKKLPVRDIEENLLFFSKQFNTKKNFLENFKDINGRLDFNLSVTEGEIYGEAVVSNLTATTVPLNVPLSIKNLIFDFKGKNVYSMADAIIGGERAIISFYLSDMRTPDMIITGNVKANLTNAFAKKYINNLHIIGRPEINVEYLVKDGTIDTVYQATVPSGADIFYYGARLGLIDKTRLLSATTVKKDDIITLINYKYSVKTDKINDIIFGDGVFNKQDGKYRMEKITGKTAINAPVSLLGFLENRLGGGFFNGNLEYDFVNQKLIGSIILENTIFKGFKVKKAGIIGNDKILSILAEGTYLGEDFSSVIELKNALKNHLFFEKLDLYLRKYTYSKNNPEKHFEKPKFDFEKKVYYPKVTIKDMRLRLDEFKKDRILVQNLSLNGNVKENIFNFSMPDILFANGSLNAVGVVNFNNAKIKADFSAKGIDSNIAAFQLFNLKDQIKGIAGANLHIDSSFKPLILNGNCNFKIDEGILTKINNSEFIIKRNKMDEPYKITLSDVIKVNKTLNINPYSNITGFFDIKNENIKNANIYMQNDAISLYIEGDFDKNSEYAKLRLWGKYNAEIEKKITIFHIPLSWVTRIVFRAKEKNSTYAEKLKKVPSIKGGITNERPFNIDAEGNINNSKTLKVNFRSFELD